ALDLLFADGAHLALRLCDDHVGTKLLENLGMHSIDRESFADDRLDAVVYLAAGADRIELGLGADRQTLDVGGKIAFVRAADQPVLETQCADDLGRARKQRDYAQMI